MICPVCHVDGDPSLTIHEIAICSNCGASVHVGKDGNVRPSRFSDVENFDLSEMAQLRRARAAIARPDRIG